MGIKGIKIGIIELVIGFVVWIWESEMFWCLFCVVIIVFVIKIVKFEDGIGFTENGLVVFWIR